MLTRREFLKVAAVTGLAGLPASGPLGMMDKPNILVLAFDALSARHIQLYGYPRATMPNLARFAGRSTVFHRHYSTGSFTTTGTASLLTGLYPWSHRALQPNATVLDGLTGQNLFALLAGAGYATLGFSHNLLANILLYQFRGDIREFMLPRQLALVENAVSDRIFWKDYGVAVRAEEASLKPVGQRPNSLLLAGLLQFIQSADEQRVLRQYRDQFPRGLPTNHGMLYRLEDYIDWTIQQVASLPRPFMGYVHMMPPHDPYNPRKEFIGLFEDGYRPLAKPSHHFQEGRDQAFLDEKRTQYDEFITYADAEFGRLVDEMDAQGRLDDTWVIFTSDHGEMFERGIYRHITPTLYEPVVRSPLLVHAPGQSARQDVFAPTSGVDLLPTLAAAAGLPALAWAQGQPLLGPTGVPLMLTERPVFCMDYKGSAKFGPLRKGTSAILRGDHKLIYYSGYDGFDEIYELYDLAEDPEELNNLSEVRPELREDLHSELAEHRDAANFPSKP
ncbi:MAG: sulfatase-like hydrolase/transferase [Chloroflexi bacterium]|nr:sulfatase-like hydrolase/transferase [Chloroflexota bacterium]